jgi:hypothetical protein
MSACDYVAAMVARSGAPVRAVPRWTWPYWLADFACGMETMLIRHPNRHLSTLHNWQCRAHRAVYDGAESVALLGWCPAGTRDALVDHGIHPSVDAQLARAG